MTDKQLLCVANLIQEALCRLRKSRYLECLRQLSLFTATLQEAVCDVRKLGLAVSRDWFVASDTCCRSISRHLTEIPYAASRVAGLLDRRDKEVPSLSALAEELRVLHDEFDQVEFDLEEVALCVVTEPITLEDIYLGPFRIALYLTKLGDLCTRTPYYIVAVEPHPAAKDEAITHPHVSNEALCEGDGAAAIRAALEEGRLCDFFVMVRAILTTYNPDSPYVALKDWQGVCCYDCGYVMDDEESYYCTHCENAVCDQCSRVCVECSEIVCHDCASTCEVCDRSLCPNCAKTKCTECASVCCDSCLTEGLCPDCKEQKEQEDEEQETEREDETATEPQGMPMGGRVVPGGIGSGTDHAAVQPDSLGQAPVPAGQVAQ